jgi:hypothetical protein
MKVTSHDQTITLDITDRTSFEGNTKLEIGRGNQGIGFDPAQLGQLSDYLGEDGTLNIPGVGMFKPSEDFDYDGTINKLETALANAVAGDEGALDALKSLLGELGIGAELSELMVEFAAMGRQNALDQRLASREQAKDELLSQASATREAAVTQVVVAAATLAVSALTAGLSLSQAGKAGETSKQLGKLADEGGDNQAQVAAITNAATKTQLQNQAVTQGVGMIGQTFEGAGGLISGFQQAGGQVDAANAQMEQSNSDLSKKVMDDFEEIVRATIQFLKEMQQAETDLMASMTRV